MTTHLIADPAAPATAVFPAAPGWLTLSAAMTGEVPVIADRDDLLVTIAPGAGHGAPACYLPAHAHIEVDGTHLGTVDPATATPHRISDRARYAPAWGLLTHECAHAHHTQWTPPDNADPGALAAALLLEEPRIEAAHIRRRPDDRHWLRASATDIILADTKANDPAHAPRMTARDAAHTAALLLARTDGGILTRTETAPVARTVETVLGADKLGRLRALWREAFTVADDDTDAMLDLGRRWYEVVGPDPDPADPPGAPGTPSPLAESITAALGRVARAVARATVPTDPATVAAAAKAANDAAEKIADDAARTVFGVGGPRDGRTDTAGTRPPTDTERSAVRTLARALNTAGVRDRVATKTTSVLPPGRLRMRGALAREAQRAAGAIPTAEPFTRTTRTPVPTPPLRLGIACDVSGSMSRYARPVASTAWILAHAARHATVPADTATVIFGNHVRPITRPGTAPAEVTEFAARDNWEAIDTAIDALDGALGLSHPGAARLLIIVSDGDFRPAPRRDGQQRINRLRAAGCGVLWLTTSEYDTPLTGVTVHVMTDPAATAQAIGRAAT
ncbi:MAG: VWA domain-containing protein, partial [Sciscionella sp.]